MQGNWLAMTAGDLGRGIGAGRIHPVELLETHLEAASAHPLCDRIYARLTPDRARSEAMAAAARAKAGLRRGLLDGVPISWKDLFDTAGIATEAGSALLKHRTPARDAEVLVSATAAGLVCLGKTTMSELASSGLGLNPITGSPPCVNDLDADAGGSSGGAAASVAFGLAAAAIGSDTGGSVRIPAAWNDLVGLKTTHGRLSLKGVVPLCESLDTVGPLARSVEDCALLLAAMEGQGAADLTGASLAGKRLLLLETVALDDLAPRAAQGFEGAVARLAAAGARIERLTFPALTDLPDLDPVLYMPEAYAIWAGVIEAAPQKMFPRLLHRFRSGAACDAAAHVAAGRLLRDLRLRWAERVAGADAVILPTVARLPPQTARLLADVAYYDAEDARALRNTSLANALGLCALTLPTGQPSCGLSLMGAAGQEARLLRLGAAVERALG